MLYSCSTAPVSSTVLHILPGNQAMRTQQPCLRRCQRAGAWGRKTKKTKKNFFINCCSSSSPPLPFAPSPFTISSPLPSSLLLRPHLFLNPARGAPAHLSPGLHLLHQRHGGRTGHAEPQGDGGAAQRRRPVLAELPHRTVQGLRWWVLSARAREERERVNHEWTSRCALRLFNSHQLSPVSSFFFFCVWFGVFLVSVLIVRCLDSRGALPPHKHPPTDTHSWQ